MNGPVTSGPAAPLDRDRPIRCPIAPTVSLSKVVLPQPAGTAAPAAVAIVAGAAGHMRIGGDVRQQGRAPRHGNARAWWARQDAPLLTSAMRPTRRTWTTHETNPTHEVRPQRAWMTRISGRVCDGKAAGKPLVTASALGLAGDMRGCCGRVPSPRAISPDLPSAAAICASACVAGTVVGAGSARPRPKSADRRQPPAGAVEPMIRSPAPSRCAPRPARKGHR